MKSRKLVPMDLGNGKATFVWEAHVSTKRTLFRIIPRIDRETRESVLILPDIPTCPGMVMSYVVNGEHGEVSIGYYRSTLAQYGVKTCEGEDRRARDLAEWYIRNRTGGGDKVEYRKRLRGRKA